jgi:hypothetical protein
VILTLKSTEQCINEIKNSIPKRKYKSCLSFSPSEVRHISILSGESTTQKYRGFINLIMIMFIVLNLRNIYDNFRTYGIRFTQHPLEFVPYSATIGFLLLFVFVELGFRLDRLRFHHLISDVKVVSLCLFRGFCWFATSLPFFYFCICTVENISWVGLFRE